MRAFLIVLIGTLASVDAAAQNLLPAGVGFYQFGYRAIPVVSEQYDTQGQVVPVGNRFAKQLDGATMMSGRGGKDLQRLTSVLSEFDGGAAGPGSLAGDLNIGRTSGDVSAKVEARILALGYGISKFVTLFAAVPFISARVDTTLNFDASSNNAQATMDRLGDAAFQELKDGLTRASRMNVVQIKQNFLDAGYQPIDRWSHQGIGDVRVGARTLRKVRIGRGTGFFLGLATSLDLPTGYVEQPDILTDVSFGKGYPSLGATSDNAFKAGWLMLGADASYAHNLDAKVEKRVPEGLEATVPAERTQRIALDPGDDMEAGVHMGLKLDWLSPRYRFAEKRHAIDRYHGRLEGNYAVLAENSDTRLRYHEVSVALDSTRAYRRQTFPIPFVMTAKAHIPQAGRNATIQKYYELSLMSFFGKPR